MGAKYSYKVWARFPDQGNPFLETCVFHFSSALISESSPLISNLTCMPIQMDLLDYGAPLERSAAKLCFWGGGGANSSRTFFYT